MAKYKVTNKKNRIITVFDLDGIGHTLFTNDSCVITKKPTDCGLIIEEIIEKKVDNKKLKVNKDD